MQHPSYKHSNQAGFTLIEVMMALLIFAFAASSLTAGFQSSTNNSIRAEQNLQANYVAQYQIQRIVISGKTKVEPSLTIDMFDKKWKVEQSIEQLNEIQAEQEALLQAELQEFEDYEVYSESFDLDGESNGFQTLDIPDNYLVLTINITPEDQLGHATMQTLLIGGPK